jgi:hypothetical protein
MGIFTDNGIIEKLNLRQLQSGLEYWATKLHYSFNYPALQG